MKRLLLICGLALFFLAPAMHAQQLDFAFGVTTLSTFGDISNGNPRMGGGFYPSFSADYIFKNNFGVGGEVAWRGRQNLYFGFQPYRPILFTVNGMYAPKINKRMSVDLLGGIGVESVRFYQNFFTCGSFTGCTNFTSDKHFALNAGAGIRAYVTHNIFVRPEVRWYHIVGNDDTFSSNHATRYGVSIGYTFGTEEY